MTLSCRKVVIALSVFLVTLAGNSVLACECNKTEPTQKSQAQVLKAEPAEEKEPSLAAKTFGEMDQMAADSRALDKAAGLD